MSDGEVDTGPAFEEVSRLVGLEFSHDNGMRGRFYMPEIMGAGGALFDFDGDGDLDVFLCQGYPLDRPSEPDSDFLGGRLFRNDLIEKGQLGFTDVTRESGIRANDYGMGATVGDVNNDGFPDLYLTNFGANRLYLNRGDGSFEDITETANARDGRWSVSATFLDYDNDGWLDLFIGNYVDFTLETHKDCFHGQRDYCHPKSYNPQPDRLLRNRGDGSFEDVTAASRISGAFGNALGVIAADFDGNGLTDIYVANDGNPNQYWINLGDGTFEDRAMLAGCALNHSGFAEAGMGVDAADFDQDGDEDLFVTHLTGQTNTIYVNDGTGNFEDRTIQTGLGSPSTPFTGFGTAWFDYDNDGMLDILVVNGTVTAIAELVNDPFPYHQVNQLFRNKGNGQFEDVSKAAGFSLSEVSRGALFGDLDNDGDHDVIVTNNNGRVRLLRNMKGHNNGWIGIDVFDPSINRTAPGALVSLEQGGVKLERRVTADGSYASGRDHRVLFGLGRNFAPCNITITWPDGEIEQFSNLPPKQWHKLSRGAGKKGGA